MRTNQFMLKPLKGAAIFAAVVLLLASLAATPTSGSNAQDVNFRMLNIERRLDQLQNRVDILERAFQSQATSNAGASTSSGIATQALLELQRQQLSMAEQLITMQKQMLELKKAIDQQASRENDQGKDTEKKDAPKQEAKPKVQSKKP